MESRRQGGARRNGGTARQDRYSSISLDLLLQYRTVLSRQTDTNGGTSWTARVVGMPWCAAAGSTRTEALRRAREMAAATSPKRIGDGAASDGAASDRADPDGQRDGIRRRGRNGVRPGSLEGAASLDA